MLIKKQQLTKQQVILLFKNKDKLTAWEIKFIESLKICKFMVTKKQLETVNILLHKIIKNNTSYKGLLTKNNNIDTWAKIENESN